MKCSKCLEVKDLSMFYTCSRRCKPCLREERISQHEERKQLLDEIRSVPCADCGNRYDPVCMDFDHLPGSTKSFGIMNKYRCMPWNKILDEIDKCEIVCSNCHRIRTKIRRQNELLP